MRLHGVGKRYGLGGRWVLTGVDLELPVGVSVAVRGTNGSGKSTLLRMIAGVSRPTRGVISGVPPVVGYVPDRFPADRLSPVAYLTHLGRIRGLATGEARRRGVRWLERFALVGDPAGPMRALSKGNAQKVALAQALLVPPDLLVLDEPWSGLDAEAHGTLDQVVDEVVGRGATVVFTGHGDASDRVQVAYAVDAGRVTRLDAGRAAPEGAGRVPPGEARRVPPGARVARETPMDAEAGARVETDSGAEIVEIVLRGPSARPTDWGGVVHAVPTPEGLRITVRPAAVDRLLLDALSNGWSVVEVRR